MAKQPEKLRLITEVDSDAERVSDEYRYLSLCSVSAPIRVVSDVVISN